MLVVKVIARNMGEFGSRRQYIPPLIYHCERSSYAAMASGRCDDQDRYALKIALLSDFATIPSLASQFSAGYDLYSAYEYDVLPLSRQLCLTDIAVIVPTFTYGRIAPKSGLALNHGIDVFAGVVDEDYRGNVGVLLYNTDLYKTFHVERGMAIAQLICECVKQPCIRIIDGTRMHGDGEVHMRMMAAWGSGIQTGLTDRDDEQHERRYDYRDSSEYNEIEGRWNLPNTSRMRHPTTGIYVDRRPAYTYREGRSRGRGLSPNGSALFGRRRSVTSDDSSNDNRPPHVTTSDEDDME